MAATASQNEGVSLQPCGVSGRTVWIGDSLDNPFSFYVPVNGYISGMGIGSSLSVVVRDAGTSKVLAHTREEDSRAFNPVQPVESDGQFIGVFASGSGLLYPAGFIFGPDGNLYVNSYGNDQILEYQGPNGVSPGSFVKVFASLSQYSMFHFPLGITSDPAGDIYVTVTNNATNGKRGGSPESKGESKWASR
jgi:hypothetical protein